MPNYKVCSKCHRVHSSDLSHCVECGIELTIQWFCFTFDPHLRHKPILPVEDATEKPLPWDRGLYAG